MTILETLKNFDVTNANLTLWVFRKKGDSGGKAPTFTKRWIATESDLEQALKLSIGEALNRIEEVSEYGLLAQNNETSALLLDTIETNADIVVSQSADPLPHRQISDEKQILDSQFSVNRIVSEDGLLPSVSKTNGYWKAKRRGGFIHMVFKDSSMTLDKSPSLLLKKTIVFLYLTIK
ncbi:MAG: hypothetical protein AAYR33_08130 [Acetobacteraceae bacterium]